MLARSQSFQPSTSYARTQVDGEDEVGGDGMEECKPAMALLSMRGWSPNLSMSMGMGMSMQMHLSLPAPVGGSSSRSPSPFDSPRPVLKREPSRSPSSEALARPLKRQRVNLPAPVPNLTKKSRGRRVPRADDELAGKDSARKYVCPVPECGKGFSRGEHLKRHTRSIHTNDRPFTCAVKGCNRTFTRHDNLLQHQRAHATPLLVPNNDH